MIVGGIRLITYESRVTDRCGASGQGCSVVAAPPVVPRALEHDGARPGRARYAAATRPLCPPPTTMASYEFAHGLLPWHCRLFSLTCCDP